MEKFDEYGKVNKYAKYNCAIFINIEEENLVEWLILMIHQICQYFLCQSFPMYGSRNYTVIHRSFISTLAFKLLL